MRAVFDTNAVIYLHKGLLRQPLPPGAYFISAITELVLLSFHGLDVAQQTWLDAFLADINIIELDARVKALTVRLRRCSRGSNIMFRVPAFRLISCWNRPPPSDSFHVG